MTTAFQLSSAWDKLAPRTQADYRKKILAIEAKFAELPLEALDDPRMRSEFEDWRDGLAKKSLRQADLAWSVLALVLSWAVKRRMIKANPCKAGGRLYKGGARREITWSREQEQAFLAHSTGGIRLAFLLALHTGQRQGDLLVMPWRAYDGESIRLKQGKTGARVRVPVTAELKSALDAVPQTQSLILTNRDGEAWTADGFRSSWRKACARAGVEGVTFHDLRGTAATRLAIAGCSEAEIATITGHSLSEVRSILDQNYLSRDYSLAKSGIAKLEATRKKPDQSPDRQGGSINDAEKD